MAKRFVVGFLIGACVGFVSVAILAWVMIYGQSGRDIKITVLLSSGPVVALVTGIIGAAFGAKYWK